VTQSFAARNLALAFEVVRHAIRDEATAEKLGDMGHDGVLVLFDPADSELATANDALAARLKARGEAVVKLEVDHRLTFLPR
jgi:hypothetical protein